MTKWGSPERSGCAYKVGAKYDRFSVCFLSPGVSYPPAYTVFMIGGREEGVSGAFPKT